MDNLISITSDSENINIEIPIDLLIFAQENRPDVPMTISNVEEMVEYFKDRFLEFGTDENKGSDFEDLLDDFFYDACEYGEEWIESGDYATDD